MTQYTGGGACSGGMLSDITCKGQTQQFAKKTSHPQNQQSGNSQPCRQTDRFSLLPNVDTGYVTYPTPALDSMGTMVLSLWCSGRGVKLIVYLSPVPRLRINVTIALLPPPTL